MHGSDPGNTHDTRQRLIEAALLVIADKGFDGAGIRDIAQKAKANSALVQYYFGGKEGLYVEALRYAFEKGPQQLADLPALPEAGDPGARRKALECFAAYIHEFIREFLVCHGSGEFMPVELERAAHYLWNREMQYPRPSVVDFILTSIEPYMDYLKRCLQVLRPDLDKEGLFLMSGSVISQILFVHNHMPLIGYLRGQAYAAEDLDVLAKHFTEFSLRGLGIPASEITSIGVEA